MKRGAAVLVLALAACAMPQQAERLLIERDGRERIHAARYAGNENNLFDALSFELPDAPEIELLMPDGTWLPAREISFRTMLEHGARDERTFAAFDAPGPKSSVDPWIGRHGVVMFFPGKNGSASSIDVSACGKSFAQLFRTKDGTVVGFPMSGRDFEKVFGPPTRRVRFGIITGETCL